MRITKAMVDGPRHIRRKWPESRKVSLELFSDSLLHVVVVLVVGAERDERAQTETVREENLRRRVNPHLNDETESVSANEQIAFRRCFPAYPRVGESVEFRAEVISDSVAGSWKRKSSEEQNDEQHVREERREVDHLGN